MPNWGEITPLLVAFFGVIGAIFGYGVQERRRAKALEEPAQMPGVMTAIGTGIEERGKLDLIHAQGEAQLSMLTELLTLAREDRRDRDRDDMVDQIIGELRRGGYRLEPRPGGEGR